MALLQGVRKAQVRVKKTSTAIEPEQSVIPAQLQPEDVPSQPREAGEETAHTNVSHQIVGCLHCGAPVILLARTIQTFCYRCAKPINQLDEAKLYYIVPTSRT